MKIRISTPLNENLILGFVFFGNGKNDYRILLNLCKLFNGEKILVSPQMPGGKGLTSVIRMIATYYDNAKKLLRRTDKRIFIVIIDKEFAEDLSEVHKILIKYFEIIDKRIFYGSPDSLNNVYEFEITREGPRVTLFISVMGAKKCIEENLAKLIKLEYDVDIPPSKVEIRKFRKANKLTVDDLIKNAKMTNLKVAFPGLYRLLKRLDEGY